MNEQEYLTKKEAQKKIWLARVFANSGDCDEDLLLKEALEKFEAEYPIWKTTE